MQTKTQRIHWLFTLILLTTSILCFVGFPTVFTDPIPHSVSTVLFYVITYLAQNFLFAVMMGIFLLPIFLWVRSGKLIMVFAFVPLAFTLIFSFMNAKVFSFWRIFINPDVTGMFFSKAGSQIFEIRGTMYDWIFTTVLIFLIIC